MSRHLHAESSFGRALFQGLSFYIGVLVSAALLLSWYVILRESDTTRQYNMGPFIVVAAPFLSVPLVLLAVALDRLLFFWAPSLASRWSWYFLGAAYGSFWSAYPLTFFVSQPRFSLILAAVLAVVFAAVVRLGDHLLGAPR